MFPEILLDNDGYPSDEWIEFIKNYTADTMPIMEFVNGYLVDGWHFSDWGFSLGGKYRGKRKLQLHTGGWSGNEEIIAALLDNFYLRHGKMRYVKWVTGGHYYFEINMKP